MILALFIMANLIIAVILQNFSSVGEVNPDLASRADIDEFNDRWNEIDSDGNGYIIADSLATLLMYLDRPLRPVGVPSHHTSPVNARSIAKVRRRLNYLVSEGHLPERLLHGYIEYKYVLEALIDFSFFEHNRNFMQTIGFSQLL